MYVSRAASRAAPAVLRAGMRCAARPSRSAARTIPAIAILIPHRAYATEQSRASSSGNYPPPGFNAEQAQKPLPVEEQQQNKSSEKPTAKSIPDVSIPKDVPTSSPKTAATEAQTLTELAVDKVAGESKGDTKVVAKKEEEKKMTMWEKVKHEAQHYWDGTKLLVAEVKISSKLALKMAAGYELTRREHRQVCSTVILAVNTALIPTS